MYRVTGTHLLLPDLAIFGLPLDNAPPAEYVIDLLKIAGIRLRDRLPGILYAYANDEG